jgi:hypothetical protein
MVVPAATMAKQLLHQDQAVVAEHLLLQVEVQYR